MANIPDVDHAQSLAYAVEVIKDGWNKARGDMELLKERIDVTDVNLDGALQIADSATVILEKYDSVMTNLTKALDVERDRERKNHSRVLLAGSISILASIGCLYGVFQFPKGFWFAFFSAASGAFLTFVLINILLERVTQGSVRDVVQAKRSVAIAESDATKAKADFDQIRPKANTLRELLEENRKALKNLPELAEMPEL